MDLVQESSRRDIYAQRVRELRSKARDLLGPEADIDARLRCCGTSIWDETLYRAWSKIIHSLIPNIAVLESNLDQFAGVSGATEVVVFERKTFLVVARSGEAKERGAGAGTEDSKETASQPQPPQPSSSVAAASKVSSPRKSKGAPPALGQDDTALIMEGYPPSDAERKSILSSGQLHPERFEKISELVKNLRGSCSKLQASFQSLEVRGETFAAYLDVLTADTYILVIVADPSVGECVRWLRES